jgi:dephospho-CoA kinase
VCAVGKLPLTILVQGGIASGKSTIARLVAELGGEFVDCDALGHQALELEEVKLALRAEFGSGIFAADGSIDRKAVAAIVFKDEEALARLEAIVHPRIVGWVQERIDAARTPEGERRQVVVIDAAVAERMKLAEAFDLTLFVSTTPETRRRRAVEIRGWDPQEIERREARQASLDSKRGQADAVIPNDGDLDEAKAHVKRFWNELVEPKL